MSKLRQKMIRAMELKNLSANTQRTYLTAVTGIAKHYRKSPDKLSKEMIEDYLLYLKKEKGKCPNTCASALSGLRFFYKHVADQQISIDYSCARKVRNLPTVLPQEDIWNIINAPDNLKHRLILMTTYSAGLRASEVLALKPEHIESKKMLIKVKGKGRQKPLYTVWRKDCCRNCDTIIKSIGPIPICSHLLINIKNTSHCPTNRCAAFMKRPVKRPLLKMASASTPCAIRLPPTCWKPDTISEKYRSSWAIRRLSTTMIYLHVSRQTLASIPSPLDLFDPQHAKKEDSPDDPNHKT